MFLPDTTRCSATLSDAPRHCPTNYDNSRLTIIRRPRLSLVGLSTSSHMIEPWTSMTHWRPPGHLWNFGPFTWRAIIFLHCFISPMAFFPRWSTISPCPLKLFYLPFDFFPRFSLGIPFCSLSIFAWTFGPIPLHIAYLAYQLYPHLPLPYHIDTEYLRLCVRLRHLRINIVWLSLHHCQLLSALCQYRAANSSLRARDVVCWSPSTFDSTLLVHDLPRRLLTPPDSITVGSRRKSSEPHRTR